MENKKCGNFLKNKKRFSDVIVNYTIDRQKSLKTQKGAAKCYAPCGFDAFETREPTTTAARY